MSTTCLEIALVADQPGLAAALDRLDRFAGAAGLSEDAAFRIRLAVDELVNNVIDHGYGEGVPGEVRIRLEAEASRVTLALSDNAPLFDPFTLQPPDVEESLETRPLGGLGVHLVRNLMTEARYRVVDGRNHVLLVLDREASG